MQSMWFVRVSFARSMYLVSPLLSIYPPQHTSFRSRSPLTRNSEDGSTLDPDRLLYPFDRRKSLLISGLPCSRLPGHLRVKRLQVCHYLVILALKWKFAYSNHLSSIYRVLPFLSHRVAWFTAPGSMFARFLASTTGMLTPYPALAISFKSSLGDILYLG